MHYNKIAGKFLCLLLAAALLVGLLGGCGAFSEMDGSGVLSTVPGHPEPTEAPQPAYTDTSVYHELRLYAEGPSNIPVTMTPEACDEILQLLQSQTTDFSVGDLYRLEEALEQYRSTQVNKSTDSELLTNGLLDAEKLYRKVQDNNAAVTVNGRITLNAFYAKLDDAEIYRICQEIARVINSNPGTFDIRKVANTLDRLTVFTRPGSTSNAYVSSELAFLYNPNMIELYTMQQEALGGSPETVWQQVIDHEIMHLIQHGANDGDDANGVEIGMCRMYNLPNQEKVLPVDALYNSWILEAGAEIGMTQIVGVAPGTYQKKISYARSYNLSRFYELQTGRKYLEEAAFCHTLEGAYDALGLYSEEMQLEFLKFLYSVEITQMDPEDFWSSYEAKNGVLPETDAQTGIRMDIRTDAVAYMTRSFFSNLSHALRDGAIRDLDTVFYLLRLWELDTFGHLNYTELGSLAHAEAFVLWYDGLQTAFLTKLAESSGLDPVQVQELYKDYCLRIQRDNGETLENCDLSQISETMGTYILGAVENYSTAHFSRIRDVARWIAENRD